MRLGVLGPVHVADASGRPCTPHAFKLRVLLGTLLIESNRVVSTERLIDELWATGPPKTVRTAVQVYVSSLRKLLDKAALPGEVARIVTRPPGYILELDDQEFDLSCFEERLRGARQAEERDDLESAALLTSQALTLWRGPALHDVRSVPTLAAEARRLDELHVAACERRIRLNLKRGLHGEVISELYALTAEHPFRERLWEYLMIALHNQGRQADALRAYHTVRLTMSGELGLEPGPILRELQQVVLSHADPPSLKIVDSGLWPAESARLLAAQRVGEGAVAIDADLARLDHLVQRGLPLRHGEAGIQVECEPRIGTLRRSVCVGVPASVDQHVEGTAVQPDVHDPIAGRGQLS